MTHDITLPFTNGMPHKEKEVKYKQNAPAEQIGLGPNRPPLSQRTPNVSGLIWADWCAHIYEGSEYRQMC